MGTNTMIHVSAPLTSRYKNYPYPLPVTYEYPFIIFIFFTCSEFFPQVLAGTNFFDIPMSITTKRNFSITLALNSPKWRLTLRKNVYFPTLTFANYFDHNFVYKSPNQLILLALDSTLKDL